MCEAKREKFTLENLTLTMIHLGPAGQRLTWTKWEHSESTYWPPQKSFLSLIINTGLVTMMKIRMRRRGKIDDEDGNGFEADTQWCRWLIKVTKMTLQKALIEVIWKGVGTDCHPSLTNVKVSFQVIQGKSIIPGYQRWCILPLTNVKALSQVIQGLQKYHSRLPGYLQEVPEVR